jgi:hypothetical protein
MMAPDRLGELQGRRLAPVYVLMQGSIHILSIRYTLVLFFQKWVSYLLLFYTNCSVNKKSCQESGKIITKLTHLVYVLLLSNYSIPFSALLMTRPFSASTFLHIDISLPHHEHHIWSKDSSCLFNENSFVY